MPQTRWLLDMGFVKDAVEIAIAANAADTVAVGYGIC